MKRIGRMVWRVLAYACWMVLVVGCTSVAPYRDYVFTDPGAFDVATGCPRAGVKTGYDTEIGGAATPSASRCFSQHAIERTDKYTLFFVEFDEQGRLYDRRQLRALQATLERLRVQRAERPGCDAKAALGVSIVTFVHGWRHNAHVDDDNVALARQVLNFTYHGEQSGVQYNPAHCAREVVGVYVGWRGLSTTVRDQPFGVVGSPLLIWEGLSVWDRKNTAQNVAVGAVRELFSMLKVYRDTRNETERRACDNEANTQPRSAAFEKLTVTGERVQNRDVYQCLPVRHLIVGHSFGALIVHNAVAQQLLENVTRGMFEDPAEQCGAGPENDRAMVRGYADLIVLLNPAVEGARYEALHEAVAARTRKAPRQMGAFCPDQKPVLVSISSEGDWAAGTTFPIMRWFVTLFEITQPYNTGSSPAQRAYVGDEESRSSLQTMGQNPRYHTHQIMAWRKFTNEYPSGPKPPVMDYGVVPQEDQAWRRRQAFADYLLKLCDGPPPTAQPWELARRGAVCTKAMSESERDREREAQRKLENDRKEQLARLPSEARAKLEEGLRKNQLDQGCRLAALADIHLAETLGRQREGTAPPDGWSAVFIGGSVISQWPSYVPSVDAPSRLGEASRKDLLASAPDLLPHLPELHSPSSPVWNVLVRDGDIMQSHGDIAGEPLTFLLQQLYRTAVLKSLSPDVLVKLKALGQDELAKCPAP